MEGNYFILLNKPFNISSSKFINPLRRIYKKIGHSGTLDLFAIGLLTIGVNKATKFFRFLPKIKEYIFDIEFGYCSDSDDLDGVIIDRNDVVPIAKNVEKVIINFIGEIEQIPNKYSAIKVNGIRAYKLVRKNIDFEMKKRKVIIYELEMLNFLNRKAKFRVKCSEGVYVRSLAKDICNQLGVLGCVTFLNRTMNHGFILNSDEHEKIELSCFKNFYESICFSSDIIYKLKNGVKIKDEGNYRNIVQCVIDQCGQFYGLVLRNGGMIFPLCMV